MARAIVAVQAFLGHSDIKMTQRYAHIAPSMLRGYIEGITNARERARGHIPSVRHGAVTTSEQDANSPLLAASDVPILR